LSRVINTHNIGTERNRLTKSIVVAIRLLMEQSEPNQTSRDLAAYIVFALQAISGTVETSVVAWEKRGYWVKADRFRMDWMWCEHYSIKLKDHLLKDDWSGIALTLVSIADKLKNIKVSVNHRLGTPWMGAWKRFSNEYITQL
jgi:hypothetical protein